MITITAIGKIGKISPSTSKFHPDEYTCFIFAKQGARFINNEWRDVTACIIASIDEYTAKRYKKGQAVLIQGINSGIGPSKEHTEEDEKIQFEYVYKVKATHIELLPYTCQDNVSQSETCTDDSCQDVL
ncbi:MAG: hypothetical protein ACRCY4_09570 [Brevinema sp.]